MGRLAGRVPQRGAAPGAQGHRLRAAHRAPQGHQQTRARNELSPNYGLLTMPMLPYDLCVGDPISHLQTTIC